MNKVNRDSTKEEVELYWKEVMQYRTERWLEVSRLITCLKGFYYDHLRYEAMDGTYVEYETIYDFCEQAKRPFGNKDTTQSIIFLLGWDTQWSMCKVSQPDWVSKEADTLYEAVLEELAEEQDDEPL